MSIDLNKIKIFHEKMENNKWYDLESLKKKPNCLSEVKEVKDFFQKYSVLDKKDMEQVISYKGHVHYYPWNIEIITSSESIKRRKHKKTGKDYNYKLGLPLTAETFSEYMEEVEDLIKEVGGQRENDNSEKESILNHFKQHNIKSITLQNNQLLIEYNTSQTEIKDPNNQELQAIKSYAEKLGKSEITLKDLEASNPSQTPKSNQVLYWGLGIVGVLVAGVIVWLIIKNKNKHYD